MTAVDALMGTKKVGKTVVVIGGGEVGCEVAVWLAKQGKKTTVVEILPQVLGEMHFINKWMLEKMLREAGVTILTGSKVVRISDKGVVIQRDAEETALKADTVVLSVGLTAQRSLAESLDNEVKSLHVIGDCVDPREIKSAIWEGYNAARII